MGHTDSVFLAVTYYGVFNTYIENVKKQTGEKPIVISVGSGLGYHEVLMEKFLDARCYNENITKCKAANKMIQKKQ
ncbi:hypothetical protein RLOatenuis_1300 [Rickettsiales bacterium]|nr:hypothetical protein RLOatenuis_1300 [Rickettsiales bacterium]